MLHGTAEAGNGGSLAWAPVLAVAAVLALVCWRVVTLAVADFYLASGAPQDALSWRASHPTALIQLAEGRLIAHDREEAAARALAALAAAPIGGGGYRILGQVAVEQSAPVRAEQMMALAVARDPRDVVARLWLAQQAIKNNDAAAAIAQFDRVMRVAPDAQPKIFPVLALFAAVPSAVPALADNLAQRPPWRTLWLQHFASAASDPSALKRTFSAIRRRGGLESEENAAFIRRLVADRRWDEAFLAWAESLTPAQLAKLTVPFNGDFELPAAAPPFDWLIDGGDGVDARVQALVDGRGHALRVELRGRRSSLSVRQLLRLQPGEYRLQWRSRYDGLDTPRGLRWVIDCAEQPTQHLGASATKAGSSPWTEESLAFAVPARCPAQWLRLELDARIAAETYGFGTAWFDDLRVAALKDVTANPPAESALPH